jgi:hypothetical protein
MSRDTMSRDKIKVNIYLTYPNHVYYEMIIDSHEIIKNLLKYVQGFFPKTKYAYNTDDPIFILINMEKGEEMEIDASKSYIELGLCSEGGGGDDGGGGGGGGGAGGNDTRVKSKCCYEIPECSIKIKLRITELKDNRT